MKKLLLFLMAFLLFAPPEAIAETKTVKFIGNPSGSTSSSYKGWKYSADEIYNDEDGVERTKYGVTDYFSELKLGTNEELGQIKERDGDIIVRFIYHGDKPVGTTNKYVSARGTRFEFYIGGFDIKVTSSKPDKIKIKEVKFTQRDSYANGMPNLSCSNGTCSTSGYVSTWTISGDPSEVIFNVKAIGEGAVNCVDGNPSSDYSNSILQATAIEITYEEVSAPDAPKLYRDKNRQVECVPQETPNFDDAISIASFLRTIRKELHFSTTWLKEVMN
jgi:hypothetical protein